MPGTSSSLEEMKQDPDGQIKTDKLQMRGLLLLLSWHIPARFVYVFTCVSIAMAEHWHTYVLKSQNDLFEVKVK